MILGEVKARPKDIISFSLDYISKSKVETSNPSSSPTPLDTPARPADFVVCTDIHSLKTKGGNKGWTTTRLWCCLLFWENEIACGLVIETVSCS